MCIVRDKDISPCQLLNFISYLFKHRGILHHGVSNAREIGNEIRNGSIGLNQCRKFLRDFFAIKIDNRYLSDAVAVRMAAGSFDINNGIHEGVASPKTKEKKFLIVLFRKGKFDGVIIKIEIEC